jgi:SP family myo-inositol transporter-like MFS transporter 13
MPETPRWLVKAGKVERARGVLENVYGDEDRGQRMVKSVLKRVAKEIEEEERGVGKARDGKGIKARIERTRNRFGELLNGTVNRRALLVACMLQGAQQLCGFVRIFPSQLRVPQALYC